MGCSVDGCAREGKIILGYCRLHYKRFKRLGTVDLPPRPSLEQRFWAKVDKTDNCWLWTGAISGGYGLMKAGADKRGAHVVSYELHHGPVPAGLTVDHLCHNGSGCEAGVDCLHRRCVNPDHLEAIPGGENALRGEGVGAKHSRKTHCPQGHPYEGENLRIKTGKHRQRVCRQCARDYEARKREATV